MSKSSAELRTELAAAEAEEAAKAGEARARRERAAPLRRHVYELTEQAKNEDQAAYRFEERAKQRRAAALELVSQIKAIEGEIARLEEE